MEIVLKGRVTQRVTRPFLVFKRMPDGAFSVQFNQKPKMPVRSISWHFMKKLKISSCFLANMKENRYLCTSWDAVR